MKKDAYYFSHDSNAKDDPKCSLLIEQLGLEGYGIFWVLVETLRDQPGYKYPMMMLSIIARKYNTTAEKVRIVVESYGLFKIDEDHFFSLSLCKRMEKMQRQIIQRVEAGKASGEKRKLLLLPQNIERPFNDRSTTDEQMKLKETKLNEIKRKEITRSSDDDKFHSFWREYPNKKAKPVAEKAWKKINPKEHPAIMDGLERAKQSDEWSRDGGKYIPHPATWLNGRRWEDEYGVDMPTTPALSVAQKSIVDFVKQIRSDGHDS